MFDGINVIAAVQSWWLATPSISSQFTQSALFHKAGSENVALPYATIFLVSEVNEIQTTSYEFDRTEIQINVHAATDFQAVTLALAIRVALIKQPLSVNGLGVCHVLRGNDGIDIGEGLAPNGQDCWVAFETFDIPWTT